MLLADATSKEQVEAALAAGDEELLDDIESELKKAQRRWESDPVDHDREDPVDLEYHVESESFANAVIMQSPKEYELENIPRDFVKAALNALPERTYRHTKRFGPFYVDYDHCKFFDFEVKQSISYYFPSHWAPTNAEFIPESIAKGFWEDLGYRLEWDHSDSVGDDNWAYGEGESVCITADESDFTEFCRDLIAEYINGVVKTEPEKAKEVFFKSLATRDRKVAAALKEAGLPEDEMIDLTSQWFTDQDEAFDAIQEYVSAIEETGEPNEVLGEWSKQDITNMGIRQGTLFENAPWKLIKLHASNLRGEGRMMNHCVGQSGMGYVDAVKRGEIEIWSLRSRDNKPRFTLEVSSKFYGADEAAAVRSVPVGGKVFPASTTRGQAIDQLKGKGNRTPGYADVRRTGGIKFPDEVIFWTHAFHALDVDPESVQDFEAYVADEQEPMKLQANDGEQCVGFDRPYQPSEVRQNRRSSKRRSSKRRSSKRRTTRRRSSKIRS